MIAFEGGWRLDCEWAWVAVSLDGIGWKSRRLSSWWVRVGVCGDGCEISQEVGGTRNDAAL